MEIGMQGWTCFQFNGFGAVSLNILAFFAHPDDETMLAGGTLALLARNGANVHYLCATRGEGGEVGEPPLCTLDDLGAVRTRELNCAVQVLGGESLTVLDYVDPRVGLGEELYPYTEDISTLTSEIVDKIERISADVVVTHGSNGEYGHPAHVISHQAVQAALAILDDRRPDLLTVSAVFPDHPRPRLANDDDPADFIIDVSQTLTIKTAAALCHCTQHALFVRRSSRESGRQMTVPEVIMPVESLHVSQSDPDRNHQAELAALLEPWAERTSH